jgi:hypothetical protein
LSVPFLAYHSPPLSAAAVAASAPAALLCSSHGVQRLAPASIAKLSRRPSPSSPGVQRLAPASIAKAFILLADASPYLARCVAFCSRANSDACTSHGHSSRQRLVMAQLEQVHLGVAAPTSTCPRTLSLGVVSAMVVTRARCEPPLYPQPFPIARAHQRRPTESVGCDGVQRSLVS